MDAPEDDLFILAAEEIEKACKEEDLPKDVKARLEKNAEKIRDYAEEIWKSEEDEEAHDGCPSCSGGDIPKILQIMPAPKGIRAVFAEPDTNDITKMSVESVEALAAMDNNGFTFITGVCMYEENFVECETVATFMGYIREGESPDKYAKKTQEFLANRRKHEEEK